MVLYRQYINLITVERFPVLILVVVDNGLVHIMNKIRVLLNAVLILVVVDNGLVLVDMVDGDFDYGS